MYNVYIYIYIYMGSSKQFIVSFLGFGRFIFNFACLTRRNVPKRTVLGYMG